MPNYNTIVTPEQALPCTQAQYEELAQLLDPDEDQVHGFTLDLEDDVVHLVAEEAGIWSELPKEFLAAFGKLIAAANLPYLEFGAAFTCGRLIPGSHGGTAFRIFPDGSIAERMEGWVGD